MKPEAILQQMQNEPYELRRCKSRIATDILSNFYILNAQYVFEVEYKFFKIETS